MEQNPPTTEAAPPVPDEQTSAETASLVSPDMTVSDPPVEAPPVETIDAALPAAEASAAPLETGQPPKKARRRPIGLIVALVIVVVLLLAAGGGFFYLRQSETRLLDQAQAAQKAGDWAGIQDDCAQLTALPMQNLLVDPQRCLPLRGEAFFQQGKLDQALADLQAANLRYPDQSRTYVLITEIYAQQGKTEQALTAGVEAQKRDDTFALPYTLQALDAFKRGQYKDAETAAQASLKRDPKQAAALRVLGILESWRGDAMALDHLNQAITLVPTDIEALAARGFYYYEQGNFTDFDTDAAAALNISMTSPESLLMQAMRARLDNDLPKAYKLVDQAIQQKTDRPEYYYYRGVSFPTTEKDFKTSFADLDKALQLAPDFYLAQRAKLAARFYSYETVDLVTEGNRLVDAAPGLGVGQALLIMNYSRSKDWEHALQWANKLVEIHPKDSLSYILRGEVYTGQNENDLALIDYQKALVLYPNSTGARMGIATVYTHQGNTSGAMGQLNDAVQVAPNAPDSYIQRAFLNLGDNKIDRAREDIDKALQLDPLDPNGLSARVMLNIAQSDFTKATEDITRIADLFPKVPGAHILRGMVYMGQKDADAQRALDEFKQAIEIEPTDSMSQSLAAQASFTLKNYDQAMAYASEALRLDPKDGDAQAMQAQIYFEKKDYAQTLTAAKLAIKLKPSQAWLYLTMADANVALGDYAAAAQNLKDALANQDKLSADGVQRAEKNVGFYATVPPLVNGVRTVTDKTNGFSLSYSSEWTPTAIPSDFKITKLILTDSNEDSVSMVVQVVEYNEPYAYLVTAQMFADYFRQSFTLEAGYKFSTRAQFKGQEFGTVDAFERTYKDSSGKTVVEHGQLYVFYVTGRAVIIEVYGPPDAFAKCRAEADKVAATFKFIK